MSCIFTVHLKFITNIFTVKSFDSCKTWNKYHYHTQAASLKCLRSFVQGLSVTGLMLVGTRSRGTADMTTFSYSRICNIVLSRGRKYYNAYFAFVPFNNCLKTRKVGDNYRSSIFKISYLCQSRCQISAYSKC